MNDDSLYSDEEYLLILDLFYQVVEFLKGNVPEDVRLPDVQALAFRLFSHASSVYWLYRGTRISIKSLVTEGKIVDFGSIVAITRASLETYRKFFEVYISPNDDDEFEFEYCFWHLSGLILYRNYEAYSEESAEDLRNRLDELSKVEERIKSTKKFQHFLPKEQGRILNGFRKRSWENFAKEAGFGSNFLKNIYRNYSGYVHADAVASQQQYSTVNLADQEELAQIHLIFQMILLSKFILNYTEKFSETS